MNFVTPHVGVWIEIFDHISATVGTGVTPHVGVWIEIIYVRPAIGPQESLPTWECGLKYYRC